MSAAYAKRAVDASPSATFERAHAHAEEVGRRLQSKELLRAEHGEVEEFIEKQGREWARLMMEEQFELRAAMEQRVAVVGAEGVERSRVRDTEKHLETLVGTVAVPRLGYQKEGLCDLHPMDAALNLAGDRYSFGVRKLTAKESARASFDEVVELIRERTGATVAKRQVEEMVARAARDFDKYYEVRQYEVDAASELRNLSTTLRHRLGAI